MAVLFNFSKIKATGLNCASEVVMMGILLGLHIIEPTAQYIVPLSGMTISSAMVVPK